MTGHRARILRELATVGPRGVPVLGASAAAAQTERGFQYLCLPELEDVWAAVDAWVAADRKHPSSEYDALVTALTGYQMAGERSMGFRP